MKQKDIVSIGAGALSAIIIATLILKKKDADNSRPPKGAPQLDIENPGSQHEFPSSPGESEIG